MWKHKDIMNYTGQIKNPSNSRINKVNKILKEKYNTKNFNTLTNSQMEYGSQLLNIPFNELKKVHLHFTNKKKT
tara:strand:+ start:316 stop:537 length:222 start_codon:yes stop_codon:yes gene_type:complete